MSRAWLVGLAMVCGQSLMAQGTVVRPEPPLDSARATLRDALLVLRDSLGSIDAAAGRLQRDFRATSAASLLSRARVMRDACARSVRTVAPTREAVVAARLSTELRRRRQGELVQALDRLKVTLARCEADFGAMSRPGQGDQVRGYGNDRAVRVQTALRKYSRVVGGFLGAMGMRMTPLGPEPRPVSGQLGGEFVDTHVHIVWTDRVGRVADAS